MLPETIVTQRYSEDDGEDNGPVVRVIINMCMDLMKIKVQVPELKFDAGCHITVDEFWETIEAGILNHEVLLDADLTRLDFLRKMFELTEGLRNISKFWLKVSVFLSDMASRNVDLLIYCAACASFVLISQFINVETAAANNDINQSMSLCIGCIDRVMDIVLPARNSIYGLLSYDLGHQFLDIIQPKSIILTPNTFNIFKKNLALEGRPTVMTLDITRKFLKSKIQEDKRSIFDFYNEQETKDKLVTVIVDGAGSEIKKAIQITINLVNYSKKENLNFECNWAEILHHIFSQNSNIKNLSMKLLIAKFGGVTEYSLLEIGLQVLEQTDRDIVPTVAFIDTFKPYEDFEDTTKLLHLLRNSLNDNDKFKMIVYVFRTAVRQYKDADYVQHFSPLMTDLFELMNLVRNEPDKLCQLLSIVDIDNFLKANMFNDEFVALKATITNCIFISHTYDVVVRLCTRGLRKYSLSTIEIGEIYKKIFNDCYHANEANDEENIKATCVRFLAVDDIFNLFEKVNPVDKCNMYDAFKIWFQHNNDRETKVLLCTLIVNMLVTYSITTEDPQMSKQYIETEAELYRKYIDDGILTSNVSDQLDVSPYANIFLCTAFCRLYTYMQVFPIKMEVLNKVYSILLAYMKDRNLRPQHFYCVPISWLWHRLFELVSKGNRISATPHSLVLLWNDMTNLSIYNNHLKVFFYWIWSYGTDQIFFADTMQSAMYEINGITKSKIFVDRVLALMKQNYSLDNLESVVSLITIKMIQRKHDNPQVKMTFLERIIEHLDKKYLTTQSREKVVQFLNDTMNSISIEEKDIIQKFVNYFTNESNPTASTKIIPARKRRAASTNSATPTFSASTTNSVSATSRPNGEPSIAKRRKRSSIPVVNLTIDTNAADSIH